MPKTNLIRYALLYLPYILAWLLNDQYHASYLIAWLGSFFIFYICYTGVIKKLPADLKVTEQLMRPIFLLQIIFAGYMCCTSIFYYLNTLGYQYLDYSGLTVMNNEDTFKSLAKAQQFYVLGHAALLHGIYAAANYTVIHRYKFTPTSKSNLLLGISFVCLPLGYIFARISGLNQFSVQLSGLSFVAGTIALAFAIKEQKKTNFLIAAGLFASNLLNSLTSGFKEPIIVCVVVLGVFLLPVYGKKILPLFIVIIIFLFLVLPTFIVAFRGLANDGVDAIEARNKSVDAVLNSNQDAIEEGNWNFFVFRLSEVDMFIKYINTTPYFEPYYDWKIVGDAVTFIIPRFFWPNKPMVEQEVMTRAYNAGIVSENAMVSAKPAYIADSYLSYGTLGVWLGLFIFGFSAQKITQKAESIFGGYFLGTAVMFSGLFQIFWRGNSFEFMLSSVFWSYITMLIFFQFLKARGIVQKK